MIGSGGVMVEGCDDEVRLRDDIKCMPCQFIFFKGRSKFLCHALRAREGSERGGRGWAL